jgi:hypothetical protein
MKQEKSSERNYDKYFKKFLANFSEYEIIWRVFCFGSVPFDWSHPVIISRRQNSNDLELIIASPYGDSISFVWKPPVVVQLSNIKEILVGKVFHTELKGTYSTQAELMRIEFILENEPTKYKSSIRRVEFHLSNIHSACFRDFSWS